MASQEELIALGIPFVQAELLGYKSSGEITLNGSTEVTVANAALTANNIIRLSVTTVAGTPAGAPYVFSRTDGTGFSVKAAAGDTSVLRYEIYER